MVSQVGLRSERHFQFESGEGVQRRGAFCHLVSARVIHVPIESAAGLASVRQLPFGAALPGSHVTFDLSLLAGLIEPAVIEDEPALLRGQTISSPTCVFVVITCLMGDERRRPVGFHFADGD